MRQSEFVNKENRKRQNRINWVLHFYKTGMGLISGIFHPPGLAGLRTFSKPRYTAGYLTQLFARKRK
jgi:hypothetical protein